MSHSDPIADMLTRIRNSVRAGKPEVKVRASKVCAGIADVLKAEGYITGYDKIDDGKQGFLRIALKYTPTGESVFRDIKRVSTPGCRIYRGQGELPRVLGGLGISVVSTSKGVMSDRGCREHHLGGEVLCTVS